ncbi:MAG: hypothetical protein ACYCZ1_01445 [Candidatus Humimicrobiaceae bacterium]
MLISYGKVRNLENLATLFFKKYFFISNKVFFKIRQISLFENQRNDGEINEV